MGLDDEDGAHLHIGFPIEHFYCTSPGTKSKGIFYDRFPSAQFFRVYVVTYEQQYSKLFGKSKRIDGDIFDFAHNKDHTIFSLRKF